MSASQRPSRARNRPGPRQVRRRRRTALGVLGVVLAAVLYLALTATVFAPVDRHGSRFAQIEVRSEAVGRKLGINVIVPPGAGPRGERSLLVFLHGAAATRTPSTTRSSVGCRACAAAGARSSPSPPAASIATGTTAPRATGRSG